jgi:uncharacterized protein (DUF58 family)
MDTSDLIAKVRKIEIRTRRIVDELTGGAYHSVFKGKGMEFNEVREYEGGDDVRDIDWNVTARMGHPFIKKYMEERELTVFLLVDVSASGDFGTADQRKNEQAAELAALLAFSAIRNNDQVGMLLFSDRDELHLPARKGRQHVLRLVRELLAFERRGKKTDIRSALETFMRVNHRKTVVFLISDLIDQGYEQTLTIVNKRHDVVAMRVLDPLEREIPAVGYVNVEDAESGESVLFPGYGKHSLQTYAEVSSKAHAHATEHCRKAGVDLIDIVNGQDYVRPLMRFFRERERRR